MISCSNDVRRCRPLLGTFVEITAASESREHVCNAVELAFAAIERVQRLMSFYEPASDVTRLNRFAARRSVAITPWTFQVLQAAERLHQDTHGTFDITVAAQLLRWGYLPARNSPRSRKTHPTGQGAIELLPANRVRFHEPVQIDLSGIAKGFAVDKAVEALQSAGVASGQVNAGGDLRVFGPSPTTIHVRHPGSPGFVFPIVRISDGAFATSAAYFSRKKWRGRWTTPLVDPLHGRSCKTGDSVSVQAPTCLAADALTKVVMVMGEQSAEILRAYSAAGFIVNRAGEVISTQGRDET